MPHKKGHNKGKKGPNNNKGKKKGQNASAPPPPRQNTGSSRTQDEKGMSLLKKIQTDLPTFHSSIKTKNNAKVAPEDATNTSYNNSGGGGGGGGYYEIYKRATTQFCDWMAHACPKSKMTAVNDLRQGAEEAVEHNMALYAEYLEQDDDTSANDNPSSLSSSFIVAPRPTAHYGKLIHQHSLPGKADQCTLWQ